MKSSIDVCRLPEASGVKRVYILTHRKYREELILEMGIN